MHVILPGALVSPSVVAIIKFSAHLEAFRNQMVAQTGESLKGNGEQIKRHLYTVPSSPDDRHTTPSNLKLYSILNMVCKLTNNDGR